MKPTLIVNTVVLCSLLALVSSKSVRPLVFRSNITGLKADNVTETPVLLREATVDPSTVQVVQNLKDSAEDSSSEVAVYDNVENDLNEISGEKPSAVKPIEEKPVSDATQTVSELVTNEVKPDTNENDPNPINKYCSCTTAQCKCCRDFSIPLIPVRGPGCATVRYLDNDKLSVTIKYGDFVLASRQIDSRRTTPICVPLPGGYNRFCGRVYGISRQNEKFKACLGLELRADDDVEASLRVSCFEFGPRGLATVEADPLPPIESEESEDDDDFLGLGGLVGGGGGGGDDDDDDDDDDSDDEEGAGGAGGLLAGVLEGVGVGGAADDDDFGIFRGASDFFSSLFGGDGGDDDDKKKKPSAGISVAPELKNADSGDKKTPASSAEDDDDDDDDDDEKDSSSGGLMDVIEEVFGDDDDEDDKKKKSGKENATEKGENAAEPKETDEKESSEESSEEAEDNESDFYDEDQYKDDGSDYNEVPNGSSEKTVDKKNGKKNRRDDDYGDSSANLGFWGRFLTFLN